MPEGVQSVFRYKVELDTQGLSAQLASVRDIVGQGLGQATQTGAMAAGVAGAAVNRISSDLMVGHQTILMAMPAQMAPSLPRMGIASTTLANVPGMPQTFTQELMAATGLSRAPLGVFPQQFEEIAEVRLRERIQMGAAGLGTGVLSGALAWGGGALMAKLGAGLGSFAGPIGMGVGAIAGFVLGETAMGEMEARMTDRARTMQIFGFNQFRADERAAISTFTAQERIKTLFDEDQFNKIMPAMALAGFTRGIGRGDVGAFKKQFAAFEEFAMEASLITGVQDPMHNARMVSGFRRAGVRDIGEVGRFMRQSRELAREMTELGDSTSATRMAGMAFQMGDVARQIGMGPQAMIEAFNVQAATMVRMVAAGQISDQDVSILGGTPGAAAQRVTTALAKSGRHPLMRAVALAFGEVTPGGGAQINPEAMARIASGQMTFADITERLTQASGAGEGSTTRLLTLMGNSEKLQSDLMVNQGQLLRSLTDDGLAQGNREITDGTRLWFMKKIWGVKEAEARAIVSGAPMEQADADRLREGEQRLQGEIKNAIEVQGTGSLRGFIEGWRTVKDAIGGFFDDQTRKLSEAIVKPLETTIPNKLEDIETILVGMGTIRGNSPLSVGPISFSENHGEWMNPRDPDSYQGFRSVMGSRHFPRPAISKQLEAPMVPVMTRLESPLETGAG